MYHSRYRISFQKEYVAFLSTRVNEKERETRQKKRKKRNGEGERRESRWRRGGVEDGMKKSVERLIGAWQSSIPLLPLFLSAEVCLKEGKKRGGKGLP